MAKVIGMMLQIGMEQMRRPVSVPGGVTVRGGVADEEEVEVEVDGLENGVDIPLMLYCDDGGRCSRVRQATCSLVWTSSVC